MGNIQPEITRIAGAKTTLGDYLKANGVAVAAGEKIDALAGKLSDISSLTLDSLSITTPPTRTEYVAGDSFNPAGMVVAANFSNGASLSITNYTCSPATLSAGDTAVTVSLTFGSGTKSVQQAVTVLEAKSIAYTGAYSTKTITSGGVEYTQYTITGSGTLTVEGVFSDVSLWACGGGSGGAYSAGGAGAYCAQLDAQTMTGEYSVTVGAATGNTSVAQGGTAILTANGVSGNKTGGTGGGGSGSGSWYIGKGDGVTKYPFGDSTTFQCHCAGGGGGGANWSGTQTDFNTGDTYDVSSYDSGGKGGTNGGNGSQGSSTGGKGAAGGTYGGGAGGSGSSQYSANGSSATFYGGGGGGYGAYDWNNLRGTVTGSVGSGYQGVVYIRVPA